MNLIHLYAVVSEPFIPATAKAMRSAFALPDDTAPWVSAEEATVADFRPGGYRLHRSAGALREDHGRGPGDVPRALRRES